VWLLNGDKSLGSLALKYLSNPKNRVLVSYFSLFEIAIKTSIGKMTYDDSIIDDFPNMGMELVMPNRENLKQYCIFHQNNKDPFDNILLTVALTEVCDLMTSDTKILTSDIKGLKLIDASQ